MKANGFTETVTADYDDAPRRRAGNPLMRLVRAAGCFLTLLMGMAFAAVHAAGIDLSGDVFGICAIASVASFPFIMLFWSEELVWAEGRRADGFRLFVLSVLTWFAEVLASVMMLLVTSAVVK